MASPPLRFAAGGPGPNRGAAVAQKPDYAADTHGGAPSRLLSSESTPRHEDHRLRTAAAGADYSGLDLWFFPSWERTKKAACLGIIINCINLNLIDMTIID